MKVGFLGLGAMGSAMATNVLQAGHEVHVWNRTAAAAEPLAKLGAHVAREPRDLAQVEAALTMFADDDAFRASVFDSGLFEALDRSAVFVNMRRSRSRSPKRRRSASRSAASRTWPHPCSGVPLLRPRDNSTFWQPVTKRRSRA